jgi:hypothetical protein
LLRSLHIGRDASNVRLFDLGDLREEALLLGVLLTRCRPTGEQVGLIERQQLLADGFQTSVEDASVRGPGGLWAQTTTKRGSATNLRAKLSTCPHWAGVGV